MDARSSTRSSGVLRLLSAAAAATSLLISVGAYAAEPGTYPAEAPLVDTSGLKAEVARYAGDVVLVDFWALWCSPCKETMPALVEMERKYGGKGFKVLAVSRDDPDQWSTGVVPFLKSVEARFRCVMLDHGAAEETVAWLGKRWRSELPARFLIDRRGKVVAELLSDVDDAEIEARVKKLLKKKAK